MLPDDIREWIRAQVAALQYADPARSFADAVEALETYPTLRPRTEFSRPGEIVLALHTIEPPNLVLHVPRAYPWQAPLLFVNGQARQFAPGTSVMAVMASGPLSADSLAPNEAQSTQPSPPPPSRPRPPVPSKPTASKPPVPAKPPAPSSPASKQVPSTPMPPVPQQTNTPPLSMSPVSIAPGSPRAPPVPYKPGSTRQFNPPPIPTKNVPGVNTAHPLAAPGPEQSPPQNNSRSATPRGHAKGNPQPAPVPVDLMNTASLAPTSQTEHDKLLQTLLSELEKLPDPPEYAQIDADTTTLDAVEREIEQRRSVLESRKAQLNSNIQLLASATADADRVSNLVDSQFVPPQVTDLVRIVDEEAAQARVQVHATQETLNLLPKALDSGNMPLHVYLPLVRQLAREQFHQKLKARSINPQVSQSMF